MGLEREQTFAGYERQVEPDVLVESTSLLRVTFYHRSYGRCVNHERSERKSIHGLPNGHVTKLALANLRDLFSLTKPSEGKPGSVG